ncbi:MAG TPA: hypothetical protein VKJ07_09525 [Mycobacteriales bacterium]|nr:hypothetical protein [Mycobacteriales bacterium]
MRTMLVVFAALAVTPAALASDRIAVNASHAALAVSADGNRALVTYRAGTTTRHVLVWGAINALPPSETVPQVRFRLDFTGGWKTYGHTIWQRFGNACRHYDGPILAGVVAACKAPDGSYWALQQWQPNLPHRGFPPYAAGQTDWELDVSHWTGPLAQLEMHADWAFNGHAHNLFGRLLYDGVPVHGYHTVKGTGAPQDRYGRNLYIDTLDSAYGPGWKRETSIVFRNPTGVFCYSFWPTNDASLPGHPPRPAGNGSAYRIEVIGPGVTPNLDVKVDDPGTWNPNDSAKKSFEDEMQTRQLQLSRGDAFCGGQT